MKEFIDITGVKQKTTCLGCDISSHKLIPPYGYIYEDDLINISVDPVIPIEGFLVLGVNKHKRSIIDFEENESIQIIKVLRKTIKNLKKVLGIEEVLIIQEERANHFHIWIVPIHDWMHKIGANVKNIDKIIAYSKIMPRKETREEIGKITELLKIEMKKET